MPCYNWFEKGFLMSYLSNESTMLKVDGEYVIKGFTLLELFLLIQSSGGLV